MKRLSKRLSWLLRHGAVEAGLPMDAAGWAPVPDVLVAARTTWDELARCVVENDKGRLEMAGGFVRATQGHSFGGTPVTAEALEASWEEIEDRRDSLFHGTRLEALDDIVAQGLQPMNRTHVHLAGSRNSRIGKRDNVAVLLHIDPVRLKAAGVGLFCSPNGVYLVRRIPWGCVTAAEPVSRRAHRARDTLSQMIVAAMPARTSPAPEPSPHGIVGGSEIGS